MRIIRSTIAVAGWTVLAFSRAGSQTLVGRRPALFNVEQQVSDRWMHGRQRARFSQFQFKQSWLFVDSLRNGEIYLTLNPSFDGRDSATIEIAQAGGVARLVVGFARFKGSGAGPSGDSTWLVARRRGQELGTGISLEETRLWDFVPTFPRSPPRIGLSWNDTIARVATDGPFRQSLRGTRVSRVTRDSVVGGRSLWVVEDSAAVEYEERSFERERTLDTVAQVTRRARGVVRGAHLYDPALRLYRWRADTMRLSGDAELRYPDGRTFHTPARYERTRRLDMYDSATYATRMADQRSANERRMGGMVFVPGNTLERRLADGGAAAGDSMLREWQRTNDPDDAEDLFQLLMLWARPGDSSRVRLSRVRLAAGDTAYRYQLLADRAYGREPTDTSDVRAMLGFMRDPSIAWGFNLSRDLLYENLVQGLTTWPRAAMTTGDNSTVSCTIAACRLLGEQWRSAREPRLRDVGLVALMSVDPRRWADTVIALDGPRHPLLHSAAMLARGVGATWESASKAPMPPANSDWPAWLEWMNGSKRQTTAPAAVRPLPTATRPASLVARVRFEESHRTAIRFYTTRTGRDVVGELRRGYDRASSDSGRFVFGTMLRQLGGLHLTEAEVADALNSGVAERFALARDELVSQFTETTRAPDSIAVPILNRLLAAAVDGSSLWLKAIPNGGRFDVADLPGTHARAGRIVVHGDSLPEAVRARWAGKVEFVRGAEWARANPRAAGLLLELAPVLAWGRFVQVRFELSERIGRREGEAPAQYASGATYYLMWRNGEWVVVAEEQWIT